MNHVTIATSSGIVWLTLVTHFGAALLALAAGTIALAVVKGGRLHKQSGIVFTWAMITTGILASVLSAYEGKSVVGGLFVCYLVFTAMTTVKPLARAGRGVDVALMIFAFAMAILFLVQGVVVWQKPHHMLAGVLCFGLFVATGSFFIGQMKFIPAPIRVVPPLFALGIAPRVILLYWMWRVRLRGHVSGLILPREMLAPG